MEKKKWLNTKQKVKDLKSKCNVQNLKIHDKLQNTKELIMQNKKQSISIVLAVVVIIAIAVTSTIQSSIKGQKAIDPELAKAMTYAQVEEGEEVVEGTDNVKFDAFFLRDINNDGYAESIRGTSRQIGKEDTLYMELKVQTAGFLRDAKITVNGENFYLQTALPKDQQLKENYIGNNIKKLEFNDMNNGTQKLITGIVKSGDYSYDSSKAQAIGNNINNYSKVNSVTLTGTYVGEDGVETQIEKTVEFNIDWYGTAKASINTYYLNQKGNIEKAINEEKGTINFNFSVYTQETENQLILKKNYIEAEIPELNGYAPSDVIYTGSNATFNYDIATKTFKLERTAKIADDGTVERSVSRNNNYGIELIYPLEAYQTLGTEIVQLKIPVKTYYEGYNNFSEEFENPKKSNTAIATNIINYEKSVPATGNTYMTDFEVKVGKYSYMPSSRYMVSKQKPIKLYNGQSEKEEDDTYKVMWRCYVGTNATLEGIVMKETKQDMTQVTDQFVRTSGEEESADNVISNIGVYFVGADTLLGEEGWIKVYDETTGNLLETFTKDNWNTYTMDNPYKYDIPVKHIRVETSNVVKNESSFYVYSIKEINDEKLTSKYTKEQFDNLKYIKTTLVGYLAGEEIETCEHQAIYEAPISIAEIAISNNTISTQTTEKNENIMIITQSKENENQAKWQNGTFLIKLPPEIIDIQLNEITISKDNVRLENYEIIEHEGQKFIKVVTKNENPEIYTITLNVDISSDPRTVSTTKQIELYATNENESDYYYKGLDTYDINNNLNVEEIVNHTTTNISMVAPNSLLTCQIASNYDDKNSVTISPQIADIQPVYAVVDKEKEEQTASVNVQVKNNYVDTISEVQILGKIPFEGNTYVINGENLNSTFTTKLTNEGIQVPQEIKEVTTIYYSENENPSRDLNDEENAWMRSEKVVNWDNIKTFLISMNDYTMPAGEELIFAYKIKIPNGLKFNQVAYSHHGVYFSLNTENGKYRTQTEPNKLGFRIAEKYDLELQKYQTGKDKLVPGATYSIKEIELNEEGIETEGKVKTAVTDSEGILKIANLYSEKTYEIKEIESPDDYELNENTSGLLAM